MVPWSGQDTDACSGLVWGHRKHSPAGRRAVRGHVHCAGQLQTVAQGQRWEPLPWGPVVFLARGTACPGVFSGLHGAATVSLLRLCGPQRRVCAPAGTRPGLVHTSVSAPVSAR